MFYVKAKINDAVEISTDIHDDNVFCTCPGCGCEVGVDLAEIFSTGNSDLYGTSVYCPGCSKNRWEGNK